MGRFSSQKCVKTAKVIAKKLTLIEYWKEIKSKMDFCKIASSWAHIVGHWKYFKMIEILHTQPNQIFSNKKNAFRPDAIRNNSARGSAMALHANNVLLFQAERTGFELKLQLFIARSQEDGWIARPHGCFIYHFERFCETTRTFHWNVNVSGDIYLNQNSISF